jgi:hypothetical protein
MVPTQVLATGKSFTSIESVRYWFQGTFRPNVFSTRLLNEGRSRLQVSHCWSTVNAANDRFQVGNLNSWWTGFAALLVHVALHC